MAKLKAPKWTGDYERYKKMLLIWLRTIEDNSTDNDIVSAVILGLDKATGEASRACELVLDIEEDTLYPDLATLAGVGDNVEGQARENAIRDYFKAEMQNHPEKKVTVGNTEKVIPGLNAILVALHEKFGLKKEERIFRDYEEYANLKRDKSESMKDYIIKAESLNRKLSRHQIVIPDIVLAYNLLKGANLGKEEKLARTSVDNMTFESMKKTLIKMSDGIMEIGSGDSNIVPKIKIKAEPIMYQEEEEYYEDDSFDSDWDETHDEEQQDQTVYYQDKGYKSRPQYSESRGIRSHFSHRRGNRGKSRGGNQRNQNKGRSSYNATQSHQVPERRLNRYGSTCAICKSIYHWAKECPDKNKQPTPILKVDHELVIDDEHLVYNAFSDTKNLGIIDSGAAKTVCGQKWYEVYESSLMKEEKDLIKEEESKCTFRFGDGAIVKSEIAKVFPTKICGQDVYIKANIVENDIPLLISKMTLKNAKASLNFDSDQLVMDGNVQDLITLPSNHYAIAVGRNEKSLECQKIEDNYVLHEVFYEVEDPKKMALKIHRYFAHASPDKLKKFVNQSEHPSKQDIVKELGNLDCNLCKKYHKEAPRPKTCLPMADKFNQTVALDLKFLDNGEILLHVIDLLTRFSAAMLVKNKTKEEIVEKFFRIWITIFGPPEKTLCDNGKEFCNSDFLSMCQNLNINMKTTAAFAPWSNGIVERHNALLAEMIEKIKEDTGCSSEIAICWATNAKNSMSNVHGFSPQQLVLGYNTYCPGLDDEHISLSQIENVTPSKIIADNLNAMYEARSAFLKAQNSERLKRALKGRVYKAYETKYFIGDSVYYKTGDKHWKGPGTVIGQHKKLVLVKTGGSFVRVYPNRLILKTDADKMLNEGHQISIDQDSEEESEEEDTFVFDRYKKPDVETSEKDSDSSSEGEEDNRHDVQTNQRQQNKENVSNSEQRLESEPIGQQSPETASETTQGNVEQTTSQGSEKWQSVIKDISKDRFILKTGDEIRYKEKKDDSWKKGTVLGKAGTVRGINKNRYNVQSDCGKDHSVYADRVLDLQKRKTSDILCIQEDSGLSFSKNPNAQILEKIEVAKNTELENFKHFEVYEEVSKDTIDKKAPIISSRWIIQEKDSGKIKARIVARGYEEGEMLFVDAPTVDKTSLRIFLTITAMKKWKCSSLDVKSAFLQSHKLDRTVYLSPPKDIRKKNIIWKINKPIYGLKDSAKNWYCSLRKELVSLGCIESILDPTMFCYYQNGELNGLFICHVDDFLFSGCIDFKKKVIDQIINKYDISSSHNESFDYIGMKIDQMEQGIKIDQQKFCDAIDVQRLPNMKFRKTDELLNDLEKKLYQKLLGKVNWIAHQSRPDLSFDAYNFSLFGQSPTVGNLKMMNKIITKIKTGLEHIWLPQLEESKLQILAFSDASLANVLPDKVHSGEGYVVFISDSTGNSCLVNWKSKKISRVVHSTLAAECLSLVDCLGDTCYIRNLLEESMYRNPRMEKIPIKLFVDSSQLKKAIYSTHLVTEKLLRINIAEIKQMITDKKKKISVHWIETKSMLSDCLTKTGASSDKLCEVLEKGFVNINELMNQERKHASN